MDEAVQMTIDTTTTDMQIEEAMQGTQTPTSNSTDAQDKINGQTGFKKEGKPTKSTGRTVEETVNWIRDNSWAAFEKYTGSHANGDEKRRETRSATQKKKGQGNSKRQKLMSQVAETMAANMEQLQRLVVAHGPEIESMVMTMSLKLLFDMQSQAPLLFPNPERPLKPAQRLVQEVNAAITSPVYRSFLKFVRFCVLINPTETYNTVLHFAVQNPTMTWFLAYVTSTATDTTTPILLSSLINGSNETAVENFLLVLGYLEAISPSTVADSIINMILSFTDTEPSSSPKTGVVLRKFLKFLPRLPTSGLVNNSHIYSLLNKQAILALYAIGSKDVSMEDCAGCFKEVVGHLDTCVLEVLALLHNLVTGTSAAKAPAIEFDQIIRKWVAQICNGELFLNFYKCCPDICRKYINSKSEESRTYWEKWLLALVEALSDKFPSLTLQLLLEMTDQVVVHVMKGKTWIHHVASLWKSIYSCLPGSMYLEFWKAIMFKLRQGTVEDNRELLFFIRQIALVPSSANPKSSPNSSTVPRLSCWEDFATWKADKVTHVWPYLLDLAHSSDRAISIEAVNSLQLMPIPTLEDPIWQWQSIRKLVVLFRQSMDTYKVSYGDDSGGFDEAEAQLEALKNILIGIANTNGYVSHYKLSVFAVMSTYLLDILLTSESPCIVCTNISTDMNFYHHAGNYRQSNQLNELRPAHTLTLQDPFPELTALSQGLEEGFSVLESVRSKRRTGNLVLPSQKTLHMDTKKKIDLTATIACSIHVADIFRRITVDGVVSDQLLLERSTYVADLLLARLLPGAGFPTDGQYKEILPNRSKFELDLHLERWLLRSPAVASLISSLVRCRRTAFRFLPIIKSILVSLIGRWNTIPGDVAVGMSHIPPYMRLDNQMRLSRDIMLIVQNAGWIPPPLIYCADLFTLINPKHISDLLMIIWQYLIDLPPSEDSTNNFQRVVDMERYLQPLRCVLHQNIASVGAHYHLFCPTEILEKAN